MDNGRALESGVSDRKATAMQRPLNVPVLLAYLGIILGIASAYLAGNTVILACFLVLVSFTLAVSVRRRHAAQLDG